MKNKIAKITENTWIPLGLAVVVFGGGASWLTNIAYQLSSHGEKIMRIEMNQEDTYKTVQKIEKDVVEIKTLMGVKDGSRRGDDTGIEPGTPGATSTDYQSLQRRIRLSRITNESDFWSPIDIRPVKTLENW